MGIHWLFRMKRWAQNPPSWRMVKFVFGVIAVCGLMFIYEYLYGWPEFLDVNNVGRGRRLGL